MARSIMQVQKECLLCNTTFNLEEHHVIYGRGQRELSERFGLKTWLCHEHHTGPRGVHFNKCIDDDLKLFAQTCFEATYPELSFREIFGKSYKED